MTEKKTDSKTEEEIKKYRPLPPTRPQPSAEEVKAIEDAIARDKVKLAMEKEAEKNRPPLTDTEKEVIRRREAKAKLVAEANQRLLEE